MQDKQVTPTTQTTQPFSSSNLTATAQAGTTQNNSATPAGTTVTSESSQQQYTDIYNNPVTNYLKQLGGIEPYPDASSDYVPDNFRPSKGAANTTSSSEHPTNTANPVSINNPASVVSSTLAPSSDASSSHGPSKTILLATVKPGKLPSFAHPVAQPTNSVRDAFCEALIPIFAKGLPNVARHLQACKANCNCYLYIYCNTNIFSSILQYLPLVYRPAINPRNFI